MDAWASQLLSGASRLDGAVFRKWSESCLDQASDTSAKEDLPLRLIAKLLVSCVARRSITSQEIASILSFVEVFVAILAQNGGAESFSEILSSGLSNLLTTKLRLERPVLGVQLLVILHKNQRSAEEFTGRLVAPLAGLLTHVSDEEKSLTLIRSALHTLTARKGEALAHLVAYARTQTSTFPFVALILLPLAQNVARFEDGLFQTLKTELLDHLRKRIQGTVKQPPELSAESWSALLAVIDDADWNVAGGNVTYSSNHLNISEFNLFCRLGADSLQNLFAKAMKKAPESFAVAASKLVARLSPIVDLSPVLSATHASCLLPVLVRLSKAIESGVVHTAACVLLAEAVRRSSQSEAVGALRLWCDAVAGKAVVAAPSTPPLVAAGSVTETQRLGLLSALRCAVLSLRRGDAQEALVPALLALLEKENSHELCAQMLARIVGDVALHSDDETVSEATLRLVGDKVITVASNASSATSSSSASAAGTVNKRLVLLQLFSRLLASTSASRSSLSPAYRLQVVAAVEKVYREDMRRGATVDASAALALLCHLLHPLGSDEAESQEVQEARKRLHAALRDCFVQGSIFHNSSNSNNVHSGLLLSALTNPKHLHRDAVQALQTLTLTPSRISAALALCSAGRLGALWQAQETLSSLYRALQQHLLRSPPSSASEEVRLGSAGVLEAVQTLLCLGRVYRVSFAALSTSAQDDAVLTLSPQEQLQLLVALYHTVCASSSTSANTSASAAEEAGKGVAEEMVRERSVYSSENLVHALHLVCSASHSPADLDDGGVRAKVHAQIALLCAHPRIAPSHTAAQTLGHRYLGGVVRVEEVHRAVYVQEVALLLCQELIAEDDGEETQRGSGFGAHRSPYAASSKRVVACARALSLLCTSLRSASQSSAQQWAEEVVEEVARRTALGLQGGGVRGWSAADHFLYLHPDRVRGALRNSNSGNNDASSASPSSSSNEELLWLQKIQRQKQHGVLTSNSSGSGSQQQLKTASLSLSERAAVQLERVLEHLRRDYRVFVAPFHLLHEVSQLSQHRKQQSGAPRRKEEAEDEEVQKTRDMHEHLLYTLLKPLLQTSSPSSSASPSFEAVLWQALRSLPRSMQQHLLVHLLGTPVQRLLASSSSSTTTLDTAALLNALHFALLVRSRLSTSSNTPSSTTEGVWQGKEEVSEEVRALVDEALAQSRKDLSSASDEGLDETEAEVRLLTSGLVDDTCNALLSLQRPEPKLSAAEAEALGIEAELEEVGGEEDEAQRARQDLLLLQLSLPLISAVSCATPSYTSSSTAKHLLSGVGTSSGVTVGAAEVVRKAQIAIAVLETLWTSASATSATATSASLAVLSEQVLRLCLAIASLAQGRSVVLKPVLFSALQSLNHDEDEDDAKHQAIDAAVLEGLRVRWRSVLFSSSGLLHPLGGVRLLAAETLGLYARLYLGGPSVSAAEKEVEREVAILCALSSHATNSSPAGATAASTTEEVAIAKELQGVLTRYTSVHTSLFSAEGVLTSATALHSLVHSLLAGEEVCEAVRRSAAKAIALQMSLLLKHAQKQPSGGVQGAGERGSAVGLLLQLQNAFQTLTPDAQTLQLLANSSKVTPSTPSSTSAASNTPASVAATPSNTPLTTGVSMKSSTSAVLKKAVKPPSTSGILSGIGTKKPVASSAAASKTSLAAQALLQPKKARAANSAPTSTADSAAPPAPSATEVEKNSADAPSASSTAASATNSGAAQLTSQQLQQLRQRLEQHSQLRRLCIHSLTLLATDKLLTPSDASSSVCASWLVALVAWLLQVGVVDEDEEVRSGVAQCAVALVGGVLGAGSTPATLDTLLSLCASCLGTSSTSTSTSTSATSSNTSSDKKKSKNSKEVSKEVSTEQRKEVDEGLDEEVRLRRQDQRATFAISLLGSVARHLDAQTDARLPAIYQQLLTQLHVPARSVQSAAAEALVPLTALLRATPSNTASDTASSSTLPVDALKSILRELVDASSTYAVRRGSALGLAALVKGLGIACLKQLDVIATLKDCFNPVHMTIYKQEGALFAFAALSERLGLLFEPYLPTLVEHLLGASSHATSSEVRAAAEEVLQVVLKRLSAHGVKQLLQPLLSVLGKAADNGYQVDVKSRCECLRLLGGMLQIAPKQMALSLPQLVPLLTSSAALDPHPKGREAAKHTLSLLVQAVKSPEIQALSSVLLQALADPSNHTKAALEALLDCEFLHAVDAAALSLLAPVLSRAMRRDRSGELKRKAAVIAGTLAALAADTSAVIMYLALLWPALRECALDPLPEVRAAAAKAIGRLYLALLLEVAQGGAQGGVPGGAQGSEAQRARADMRMWLLRTLLDPASLNTSSTASGSTSVERSGAAQALAEIVAVSFEHDERAADALVYSILLSTSSAAASSSDPQVVALLKQVSASSRQEGAAWFLCFLPYTLRTSTARYVSAAIDTVLRGLRPASTSSDTSAALGGAAGGGAGGAEEVREVSLRAGKVLISVLAHETATVSVPVSSDGHHPLQTQKPQRMASILCRALLKSLVDVDEHVRRHALHLLNDLLLACSNTSSSASEANEEVSEEANEEVDQEVDQGGGAQQLAHSSNKTLFDLCAALQSPYLLAETLAHVYLLRCDATLANRQLALACWKAFVLHTPKTLLALMTQLVSLLVRLLSADDVAQALGEADEEVSSEQQMMQAELKQMAARCIGEVVHKLGDKVLSAVLLPLQSGLTTPSTTPSAAKEVSRRKHGLCLGLEEVLRHCSSRQAQLHVSAVTSTLLAALCDSSEEVRQGGARAFATFCGSLGTSAAVELVLPALLSSTSADHSAADIPLEHIAANRYLARYTAHLFVSTSSSTPATAPPRALPLSLQALQAIVKERPRDMLDHLLPLFLAPLSNTSSTTSSLRRRTQSAQSLGAVLSVSTLHLSSQHVALVYPVLAAALCLSSSSSVPPDASDEAKHAAVLRDQLDTSLHLLAAACTSSGVHTFILEAGRLLHTSSHSSSTVDTASNTPSLLRSVAYTSLTHLLTSQAVDQAQLRQPLALLQQTQQHLLEHLSLLLKYLLWQESLLDRQLLSSSSAAHATALRDCWNAFVAHAATAASSSAVQTSGARGSAITSEEVLKHCESIKTALTSALSAMRHSTAFFTSAHTPSNTSSSGEGVSEEVQAKKKETLLLPFLTVPKALDAFLQLLLGALTSSNTSSTTRGCAADVLHLLVRHCSAQEVLSPAVTKILGPLIRLLSASSNTSAATTTSSSSSVSTSAALATSSHTSSALLGVVSTLLQRCADKVKAFAPQLQSSLVRVLAQDASSHVRRSAASALGHLLVVTTVQRLDVLLAEISAQLTQTSSKALQLSLLEALVVLLQRCPDKMLLGAAAVDKVVRGVSALLPLDDLDSSSSSVAPASDETTQDEDDEDANVFALTADVDEDVHRFVHRAAQVLGLCLAHLLVHHLGDATASNTASSLTPAHLLLLQTHFLVSAASSSALLRLVSKAPSSSAAPLHRVAALYLDAHLGRALSLACSYATLAAANTSSSSEDAALAIEETKERCLSVCEATLQQSAQHVSAAPTAVRIALAR